MDTDMPPWKCGKPTDAGWPCNNKRLPDRNGCKRHADMTPEEEHERWQHHQHPLYATLSAICHGHEHAERHILTQASAGLLLEWLSGEDWSGGPRCLMDLLAYIEEEGAVQPPLARR